MPAADAGAWGIKESPRPDTLPEIVSVATDTAEVPLRRGFDPAEIMPLAFTFRIGRGPEPGRLRFSTTLVDLGPPLEGRGPPLRQLILRSCPFALQVYRSADLQGKPAWDSWRWLTRFNGLSRTRPSVPWAGVGCPSANPVLRLPPGDSLPGGRLLGWDGHVMDILGDSLPEGRYHVRAQIRLAGDTLRVAAGNVDLRRVPRPGGSPGSGSDDRGHELSEAGIALTPAPSRPPPPRPSERSAKPLNPRGERGVRRLPGGLVQERRIGSIQSYGDSVRIEVPDSVQRGEAFMVRVWTSGNSCTGKAATSLQVERRSALVTVYDWEVTELPRGGCMDQLRRIAHTATLRFREAGTAEVVIRGRSEPSGELLQIRRSVVVR